MVKLYTTSVAKEKYENKAKIKNVCCAWINLHIDLYITKKEQLK